MRVEAEWVGSDCAASAEQLTGGNWKIGDVNVRDVSTMPYGDRTEGYTVIISEPLLLFSRVTLLFSANKHLVHTETQVVGKFTIKTQQLIMPNWGSLRHQEHLASLTHHQAPNPTVAARASTHMQMQVWFLKLKHLETTNHHKNWSCSTVYQKLE